MVASFRKAIAFATVLAFSLQSTPAYAHSSEVFDPRDVAVSVPAMYDILHAKVTEQIGKGTLFLQIEVAEAIPDTPTDSSGNPRFMAFNWSIDAPGTTEDATVVVRYCSHTIQGPCIGDAWHWEGELITLTGRHVGAFPYRTDGATVKAFVDVTLLGGPALTQFNWIAVTRIAPGVSGAPASDLAPDTGGVPFVR